MPAPRIHWTAYFWPGLPQLWIRGSWVGLLVAVGFTALLNVLLLATLLFGEWLRLETRLVGGGVLVAIWLLARWQSRAERRANRATAAAGGSVAANGEESDESAATERQAGLLAAERDQWFREAQGHYLRNDWVATEQGLLKLLKLDARDAESRLMLATLWRHQGRCSEALRQLDRLERLEAASHWRHEIAAERMALGQASGADQSDEHGGDGHRGDGSDVERQDAVTQDAGRQAADDKREENQSGAPPEHTEQPHTENNDHREGEHRDHSGNERRAA